MKATIKFYNKVFKKSLNQRELLYSKMKFSHNQLKKKLSNKKIYLQQVSAFQNLHKK